METVTKATLAARLCAHGLSKRDAQQMVESFFSVIHETLAQGEEVHISGFGNFKLRDKVGRPGRNPRTGKAALIAARRVVTFKAGHKLLAELRNIPLPAAPEDETNN